MLWVGFFLLWISISVKFSKLHNFGSDRVNVLTHISYKNMIDVSDAYSTAFAVSFRGSTVGVTVAHTMFMTNGTCPANLIICRGIDIALLRDCPPASFSISASDDTEVTIGDEVVLKGFGSQSVSQYRAAVGDTYGNAANGVPCSNLPIFKSTARMLVNANQVPGLSGSLRA
jgi:hypothetical protein